MAAKKTSNPKAFEEFDKTLAAVIKPGTETVHYLMTLDGVDVPAASRTASLADAPEVIEGLIVTLEENYARFLTEEAAKAAKKSKRSSKKPAAKKKPAAAKPTPKKEADGDEAADTTAGTEDGTKPVVEDGDAADEKQPESDDAAEQTSAEEDEDGEEAPATETEQLSMMDGIDI
ncbi:MAG: hypothetical protein DWQ07_17630 [Chloroflexi bacterium]|nr:MAG: hypothetical protein DWQ07_17630 [Chloroflexota bacterium]